MDKTRRLATTIRGKKKRSESFYGVWVGPEAVDANLSQVRVPGGNLDGSDAIFRFIPKGAHVTGLTTSSTVLVSGNPMCIIAIVVGDITLASI